MIKALSIFKNRAQRYINGVYTKNTLSYKDGIVEIYNSSEKLKGIVLIQRKYPPYWSCTS